MKPQALCFSWRKSDINVFSEATIGDPLDGPPMKELLRTVD
jgi:hypothetical protein